MSPASAGRFSSIERRFAKSRLGMGEVGGWSVRACGIYGSEGTCRRVARAWLAGTLPILHAASGARCDISLRLSGCTLVAISHRGSLLTAGAPRSARKLRRVHTPRNSNSGSPARMNGPLRRPASRVTPADAPQLERSVEDRRGATLFRNLGRLLLRDLGRGGRAVGGRGLRRRRRALRRRRRFRRGRGHHRRDFRGCRIRHRARGAAGIHARGRMGGPDTVGLELHAAPKMLRC
jgi:hypothetical protein